MELLREVVRQSAESDVMDLLVPALRSLVCRDLVGRCPALRSLVY